jgi:small-conductance mechanosensitive channel
VFLFPYLIDAFKLGDYVYIVDVSTANKGNQGISPIIMDELINPEKLQSFIATARQWVMAEVLSVPVMAQVAGVFLALLIAVYLAPHMRTLIAQYMPSLDKLPFSDHLRETGRDITLPLIWLVIIWLALMGATFAGLPRQVLDITASLLAAWVVISVASSIIQNSLVSRMASLFVWVVAALSIVDLLNPAVEILDQMALQLGGLRISALIVIKAIISLGILLWLAMAASNLAEKRIRDSASLNPAMQELIIKILKVTLIILAVMSALGIVGIDLTAFAVFSGALGVGIGFGLQKVVSNLISGVILLLDRSIKPGDVIDIGETYGWVQSLGARYTSIVTRDGTEHLIPNEEFITKRVENWTHTNSLVRLHAPVGVSYDTDLPQAMELCKSACLSVDRVREKPAPNVLIRGFGDNSVNLEIRFWINDPANGRANVMSDVWLAVWEAFAEAEIKIPFPQRDINLRMTEALQGVMEQAKSGNKAIKDQGDNTATAGQAG